MSCLSFVNLLILQVKVGQVVIDLPAQQVVVCFYAFQQPLTVSDGLCGASSLAKVAHAVVAEGGGFPRRLQAFSLFQILAGQLVQVLVGRVVPAVHVHIHLGNVVAGLLLDGGIPLVLGNPEGSQ